VRPAALTKITKPYINSKRKPKMLILILILIAILVLYLWWGNNSITITKINYTNPKIPKEFAGFRIVQISDLHNKKFNNLIAQISSCHPNIIIITGDLIDRSCKNLTPTLELLQKAKRIAPIYYVSGNHEADNPLYSTLKTEMLTLGINLLDNAKTYLAPNFALLGLQDIDFTIESSLRAHGKNYKSIKSNGAWQSIAMSRVQFKKKNCVSNSTFTSHFSLLTPHLNSSDFQILLTHRPEFFDIYAESGIDLIFSGHAHGGQFRLPLIGGLYSPDQGIFPKLTSGTHTKNGSTMVVSRGLGSSSRFPLRLFNRPEIIVCVIASP